MLALRKHARSACSRKAVSMAPQVPPAVTRLIMPRPHLRVRPLLGRADVHHLAFVIQDMKGRVRTLESKGHALIQKGEYTGGRYAYIDTTRTLKTIVELLENDPK